MIGHGESREGKNLQELGRKILKKRHKNYPYTGLN
jgi:hypothetical protein